MSDGPDKFADLYRRGEAHAGDVFDFIGLWRESDSEGPVFEFLGMTEDEYGSWIERPECLDAIPRAGCEGGPLRKATASTNGSGEK